MAKRNWFTGKGLLWGEGSDEFLYGSDPSIMTQDVLDPMKAAVANPLSQYLTSQIGQGVDRYTSDSLTDTNNPNNSYSSFLSMNAGDWYDKAVADPEMKRFKETTFPLVQENLAGSLSSSRYNSAVTDAVNDFSDTLATGRYKAAAEIPQQQFAIRKQIYDAQYNDWLKSLPQYNPVLDKAISFLSNNVSSGTTTLSALNPGTAGIINDLIKVAVQAAGTAAMSGG